MKKSITFIIIVLLSFTTFSQFKKPKLVVGIVVDQMRYDYLYRYYDKFCDNGFRKLMDDGMNFKNANYTYVPTYTGPGHASIYTGTSPSNHGIVGNDWYSRKDTSSINCVQDDNVVTIGSDSQYGKFSPHRLKVNTITDQLKMTYPDSKVVSISFKNRGAILPGGHMSDGSYWFDYQFGRMVTSSFYTDSLPGWVSEFNNNEYPKVHLKKSWETLLPIEDYYESREDDSPYEVLYPGKSKPTFPYNLKKMQDGNTNFGLFAGTPFANEYLTDFSIEALKNENLGKGSQSDFLAISYSTPDIIGHAFGPYSVEIEDTYIRLDLEISRLLKALDEEVGEGNYTFFLTADHAVVPVPGYLVEKKLSGGYFYILENQKLLQDKVTKRFGQNLITVIDNNNVYLDYAKMDSVQLSKNVVENFIAEELIKLDGVKNAFTSAQLLSGDTDNGLKDMIRDGYHPKESGDVIFVLEANYLPKSLPSTQHRGTSHGSPYGYDTHVPLLWYGANIEKGNVYRKIDITDITPTLIYLLDLQKTNGCTGNPIVEILE